MPVYYYLLFIIIIIGLWYSRIHGDPPRLFCNAVIFEYMHKRDKFELINI